MKYLLIITLLFSILYADKQKLTLGAGPFFQTQPYINVDTKVIASPVIFFDNELFYIRWTRVGMYFLGEKNDDFSWALSLTMQPRSYGYDSSDIIGMDKREETFEGGLALSLKKDAMYVEFLALHDLLNKHNSWVAQAELGYEFTLGNISIIPSFIALYQAEKFVDYYYGVTSNEAIRRSESQYLADAGLQLGVQTFISYPFTKNLTALVNLRADRLPSSAYSSTIVQDKYIYSGLASLLYTFEY